MKVIAGQGMRLPNGRCLSMPLLVGIWQHLPIGTASTPDGHVRITSQPGGPLIVVFDSSGSTRKIGTISQVR